MKVALALVVGLTFTAGTGLAAEDEFGNSASITEIAYWPGQHTCRAIGTCTPAEGWVFSGAEVNLLVTAQGDTLPYWITFKSVTTASWRVDLSNGSRPGNAIIKVYAHFTNMHTGEVSTVIANSATFWLN